MVYLKQNLSTNLKTSSYLKIVTETKKEKKTKSVQNPILIIYDFLHSNLDTF